MYRILVLYLAVLYVTGEDLQVGSSVNNVLVYTENVNLNAILLTVRTKSVFYNGNDTRLIKGIWAVDLNNSKAKATITAGGVGFTFTNVKIKSERGEGLNYQVQIFV